jgi:hypothetical protein
MRRLVVNNILPGNCKPVASIWRFAFIDSFFCPKVEVKEMEIKPRTSKIYFLNEFLF